MAATNYTPIQLYYSTTASAAPTAGNLVNGELAINITDGKLYYKDNGGVVQVIATKGAGTIGGSNTQIQFNDGGALAGNAAMVFNKTTNVTTLTTLNLTNALGATYGGTAQSAYAQGDILYASATNTLSKLTIGTVNYILTSTGSVPQWVAPTSVTVQTANNLAGGAAGSVPYQSAADTTTFLAIGAANRVMTSTGSAPQWVTSLTGLTGVSSSSITNTSLTSGRVVYSTTGGAQTDSANLTFNGTTLSTTGLSNTGTSTLVKTLTLGDSAFNGTAVFAPATPAKMYFGTGTVTDVTSAASATNTAGAIVAMGITPIAATNAAVTYTNASTLYIAGAPSASTNITITNPYAFYVAAGASYFGGAVDFAVTPSYSGGTANGVMYLNGSKQITTGTALSYNGTTLTVVNNSSANSIALSRTSSVARDWALGVDGDGGFRLTDSTGSAVILSSLPGAVTYLASEGELAFKYSTSSEGMRLTSTGLGIGTSSPGYKLDVQASGNSIGSFQSTGANYGGIEARNSSRSYSLLVRPDTSNALVIRDENASSNRVILDTSGNVGIGTSSPASLLDVASTGVVTATVRSTSTSASRDAKLRLNVASTGGDDPAGQIEFTYGTGYTVAGSIQMTHTNPNMKFYTGTTERMRIDSSGRLIVGSTLGFTTFASVAANTALDSYGQIAAITSDAQSTGLGGQIMAGGKYRATGGIGDYCAFGGIAGRKENSTDGNYAGYLQFLVSNYPSGNIERARINSAGNLLVGDSTSDLTARIMCIGSSGLAVQYGASTGTNLQVVPGAANGTVDLKFDARSGGYPAATFWTGGSERMRITAAGNVGIGLSNPTQKLHVYEASSTVYGLIETGSANSYAVLSCKNPNNTLNVWNRGDNNTSVIASTAWDLYLQTDAAKFIGFSTNATERARIDSSGNVFIGTTSSLAGNTRLCVNGTAFTNTGAASDIYQGQTLVVQENDGSNYVAGKSLAYGIDFNCGNGYATHGKIALVKDNGTINNQSSHWEFWTRSGASNSTTDSCKLTIGSTGTITFNTYGAGTLSTNSSGVISASDGRFKNKTRDLSDGLSKVRALAQKAMYYLWNEDVPMHTQYEEIGWSAQDVAAVIPEASPEPEQDGKFKNYHDRAIIAYMAKAIDELAAQIEAMKSV